VPSAIANCILPNRFRLFWPLSLTGECRHARRFASKFLACHLRRRRDGNTHTRMSTSFLFIVRKMQPPLLGGVQHRDTRPRPEGLGGVVGASARVELGRRLRATANARAAGPRFFRERPRGSEDDRRTAGRSSFATTRTCRCGGNARSSALPAPASAGYRARRTIRSENDPAHPRPLDAMAVPRLTADHGDAAGGGGLDQSQAGAAVDATDGHRRTGAQAADLPAGAGPPVFHFPVLENSCGVARAHTPVPTVAGRVVAVAPENGTARLGGAVVVLSW